MSEIISSSSNWVDQTCKESPQDICVPNDVRRKWFSEVHRNGDVFEKSAEHQQNCPISDKPIVIFNGNSTVPCYPVSRDMCSTKISHASDVSCDFPRGSPYTNTSDSLPNSPAQLRDASDKVSDLYNAEQVLKSRKAQEESDRCDKMPFMKFTSLQLHKNTNVGSSATLTDASKGVVNKSDKEFSTVGVASVLENCNDITYASSQFSNSGRKMLCNGDLEKYTSTIVKSNCVESDVSNCVQSNVSNYVESSVSNCVESEVYNRVLNTKVPKVNDLNMLPDSEKRLLNEMLSNFGLNNDGNEECSASLGLYPNPETNDSINENSPKAEIVSENTFPLNALSLGDKELNFNDCLSDQHLLAVSFDNSPISVELVDVHSLANNRVDDSIKSGVLLNSATSERSEFIPSATDGNIFDLNDPDITVKPENIFASTNNSKLHGPSPTVVNEPIIDVETDDILQYNTSHDIAVTDEISTIDEILEPDFLSDNLMPKENNLMTSVSIDDIDQSTTSLSSKSLTVSRSFSPLLSTSLESSNSFENDSLLHFNLPNLKPENIESTEKSSVLNPACPIPHSDDLNSNDAESYLHKLTEASNDSITLPQNDSGSDRHAGSVTVRNTSFVYQSTIFPCEIIPSQQQCIESSGGDHVPSSYATVCGKLRLEERCPDVTISSGFSSNSVTHHGSDLHTDGIHGTPNPGDGTEMLAKVGASVAFCEKPCTIPSVFLSDDQIKESCEEIYDRPRYPDVCDKNLISLLSEGYNSFTTESCTDYEITLSDDCRVTESSIRPNVEVETELLNGCCSVENVSDLTSLDSEMMHYGICDDSIPVSDLISNGYCSGNSLQYETDVDSTSNPHESTTESNNRDQIAVNGSNSIEASSDLLSHEELINHEFSNSNSEIPNGYHTANNLPTEFLHGICDTCIPSECDDRALDQVINESEINNVKEKIQFFENGSTGIPVENCDNKMPCDVKTTTTRRKSLERSKNSMIPSLKKTCLKAVNEKESQSQKPDSRKFTNEAIIQPSVDNDLSVTNLKTGDELETIPPKNASSDGNDLFNSSSVSGGNWSLELDYDHLCDSGADNENHFVIEVNSSSSEFSKRCRSEELLSYLPKVQKFKSRLQTRRHSSTEANSCDVAHSGGKSLQKGLTTDLASPVDLNHEEETSESSLQCASNLTLDAVQGVQGQAECGLQSRCASLPLVIGQVRATSPLHYARRNCPIKDASRGKSRIPRKQSGMRGALHPKPARPPMWLSKAELTAEIQRLGTLCEARTKELNRLKMETKHVSVGFDAFASLFKYMVEDLNALSMPVLAEDLKKTLKQLELAKQDLAYYEREVEEMKAHHCQELNDLSNKLFEVFHGEVTELSAKHQEEMNRLKSDHQLQIENLSTTFDTTSQETVSKHEAAVVKLQQEIISQREELQQLHEREIADLGEKHAQSTKTLQEHIEQLQKKCAELKHHATGMEDAMRKDTDTKLQWVTSRKVDLEKEVESLKTVLEMKNKELHTLRVQNLEMEKQLEELPLAREKIKMLQARAEDLEALMIEKTKLERKLSTENHQIRDTYEKESKVNKRLSMENEELLWRIRQAEQSFLSDSFSVAEYPEDIENGSISPTKSPPPHMSRSVFFTYMDKEDQSASPRSQYKKITPGFASSYKTSPYKSPPAPSPRRAKSNSEPPQPPSHSSSTPRKGAKQTNLKQKKRQRSGSDCGKVNGDQVDVTYLSVGGSMTSSVSSESSVFGERLLEEHKEQILESLEILREQRSSQSYDAPAARSIADSDDMSRSSEFSDPKTYYHMTFPVSGMPDCDINVTAQAIHSTSESASPEVETQQIVHSREIDVSAGDSESSASSVKMAHSFENVRESAECEKQSKENRWRTI